MVRSDALVGVASGIVDGLDVPGDVHPWELGDDLVGEVEGFEDRFQRVVSVGAGGSDSQSQIDFGGSDDSDFMHAVSLPACRRPVRP